MNIKDIKKLCDEYENLSILNARLELALKNGKPVQINTQYGTFEIGNFFSNLIRDTNVKRIDEIEKRLESEVK